MKQEEKKQEVGGQGGVLAFGLVRTPTQHACTFHPITLNPKIPINMPVTPEKFQIQRNKVSKIPKTFRTEMSPVMRAFLVGAITGCRRPKAARPEPC